MELRTLCRSWWLRAASLHTYRNVMFRCGHFSYFIFTDRPSEPPRRWSWMA